MAKQYTIVDEFEIKGSKVIVLNGDRCISLEKYTTFTMDEKIYPYKITHHNRWLLVDSDDTFLGKTITLNGRYIE